MTVTDFLAFFLSVSFLIGGALRGFMKSLIIPFSIIAAIIISIVYFHITHKVITSLLIGLISPLLLYLLLIFLLKIWTDATSTVITPSSLSRLGGAIITLICGWIFIIFTLILLAVFPSWGKELTAVHDDVKTSASYISIAQPLGRFFLSTNSNSSTKFTEDPRFQETLQDPDIQKDIDTHDLVKLISNPRMINLIRQVLSDPATIKRVLNLYSSQAQQQAIKTP